LLFIQLLYVPSIRSRPLIRSSNYPSFLSSSPSPLSKNQLLSDTCIVLLNLKKRKSGKDYSLSAYGKNDQIEID